MKACILIGIKPYLTLDIEYSDFVNMLNDLASLEILVDPQTIDKKQAQHFIPNRPLHILIWLFSNMHIHFSRILSLTVQKHLVKQQQTEEKLKPEIKK